MLPEGWDTPKKILLVLAHPDDPEFFCGGTIARWTAAGHQVQYLLLTSGDKGAGELLADPGMLVQGRQAEQCKSAAVLGVSQVDFLDYRDGELVNAPDLRMAIVRRIRQAKPDVLVTCDPTNYFPRRLTINHSDHRAAGDAALAAAYPAAGNPNYFPALIQQEGLPPHTPSEVWVTLTNEPDLMIDITPFWKLKMDALHMHGSQIGDIPAFDQRMLSRRIPESSEENPVFLEGFRRFYIR